MFWPKNIIPFMRDGTPIPEEAEQRLAARPFNPVGGLEWFSEGFVPAVPHIELFAPKMSGCHLFAIRREDKVLPAGVIRDELDKRIAKIEAEELRKPGRKERLALKEQITDDLLPRAFTRSSRVTAWDDGTFLFVNAASQGKAESVVTSLREALPPFPCRLIRTHLSASSVMTDWLAAGEATGEFELDEDATLQDSGENGAKIKISRADLTAEEIRQHIANGKQVTTLGLIYRERIRFVLTDQLQIKRIQYLDMLQEEASQSGDDAASLYEATFQIATSELSQLLKELIEAMGGLQDDDKAVPLTVGETIEPWQSADGAIYPATMAEPHHGGADTDPLYARALALVQEQRRASISQVQRVLRIGYNRAARLIEHMESEGHVSGMDATGSRKVLTVGAA